jgi:hypothetical protein
VDRVLVYLDGVRIAEAHYGQPRPELAPAYGARFAAAGWQAEVDFSAVPAGPHTLEAHARSTATGEDAVYAHQVQVPP